MARIAGVIIPGAKNIVIGLTFIYGIGHSLARMLCKSANIDLNCKIDHLTEAELSALHKGIEGLCIEGDLRRTVALNIKRLIELNTYRGMRHKRRLPVRGQRTRTNAQTRKRRKKAVDKV